MRRKRKGFTFIELLVVVSLIAVLAAILFPVFARAREKGFTAECLHHLQQIAIALQLYAADHFGHYPPRDNDWEPLFPYLRDRSVLVCPAPTAEENFAGRNDPLVGPGYRYKGGLCHDDWPEIPLASDSAPWHSGGRNFLFVNGRVKWFHDQDGQKFRLGERIPLPGG
ncbi:MAG TPA: type II secretion system protein [Armatimonadetes bacterium]|nr:type II secretion system protein [Armatimonadota bacterium]